MFRNDAARQAAKEEEEREKEAAKAWTVHPAPLTYPSSDRVQVEDIASRLDELKLQEISREHISFALSSRYAAGNVERAVELLRVQQQAFAGIVLPYNPNTHMLGAENRGNVTCYLDSLLFACSPSWRPSSACSRTT